MKTCSRSDASLPSKAHATNPPISAYLSAAHAPAAAAGDLIAAASSFWQASPTIGRRVLLVPISAKLKAHF